MRERQAVWHTVILSRLQGRHTANARAADGIRVIFDIYTRLWSPTLGPDAWSVIQCVQSFVVIGVTSHCLVSAPAAEVGLPWGDRALPSLGNIQDAGQPT